jgi:hypothetical protein
MFWRGRHLRVVLPDLERQHCLILVHHFHLCSDIEHGDLELEISTMLKSDISLLAGHASRRN